MTLKMLSIGLALLMLSGCLPVLPVMPTQGCQVEVNDCPAPGGV